MRCLLLLSALLGFGSFAAGADEKYVTIRGTIKWNEAKPPAAVIVEVKTDAAVCCKAGPLESNKVEVDPKSLGVKNVMVWLRPDDTDRTKTFPLDKIHPDLAKPKSVEHVIDQPKCQFEPRVVVARAGDTLVVKNSASIGHNVNYSSDIESFNVNLPAGSQKKLDKPLEAQKSPIGVACNVHTWMEGKVRVFDHPYFAITDKDGKFEIKDAPVGKWRVVYHHEGGYHKGKEGLLGFPVELKGDKKTMEMDAVKLELPKP